MLLERAVAGGQAGTSPLIRNYPGFPHGINGGLLMERTCEQAWLMGAHIVFAQQAVGARPARRRSHRPPARRDRASARAVVIATGIEWRRLGVPRLEALVGSGVFYGAAVSESRAMQDQDVFIVGAGNSAGQAALDLAKHARSVTLRRSRRRLREVDVELPRAARSSRRRTSSFATARRSSTAPGTGRSSASRLPIAQRHGRRGARGRAVHHDRRRTAHAVAPRRDRARRAGVPRHGSRPVSRSPGRSGTTTVNP